MKSTLIAAAFAVFLTQSSFAQQLPAPGAAARTQQAPASADLDAQYSTLQAQMNQMHDQMSKIAQTTDPQERQQLLQQHWASMQNAMATMYSTFGGMMGARCCESAGQSQSGHMMNGQMMVGPMKSGHMMQRGDYRALTTDQLRERQYMMERWMPMQQMMMDQMMQHQHWMQPQSLPPPPKKQ